MSAKNSSKNNKSKPPALEDMEHYLRTNAERILEERGIKRLAELEKESLKSTCISQYQTAVIAARDRFVVESERCDDIFGLMKPILQEIVEFAEKHAIFPPLVNQIPEVPMQAFYRIVNPSISSDLEISFTSTKEKIVAETERRVAILAQEHVSGICGIEWGYGRSRYDISFFGIKLEIHPNGEVKIGELTFSVAQLNSSDFKEALSQAFYAPEKFWKSSQETRYFEDIESGPEMPKSGIKRLALNIAAFFHRARKSWDRLWDEPQFEINSKTALLKKIWYGFPTKDVSNKENND